MILKYSNIDINEITIDESFINGIIWTNDAKDLQIEIDWCGQMDLVQKYKITNFKANLYFNFIWNLEMNLKYKDNQAGAPEITNFIVKKLENEVYRVNIIFDFQPQGNIIFCCNSLDFILEY